MLVGLAAGPVLGAGVGAALLSNDAPGLWVFGLPAGGVVGVPLGLLTSALSAALILTHAATRSSRGLSRDPGVPLWLHLLAPLPVTALTTWWIVQSAMLDLGSRIAVTAGAAVIGPAWVLWTARWVMAPLTATGTASDRLATRPPASSRENGRHN